MMQLCDRSLCTGCTACFSICPAGCISMVADDHGFLFPVIDTAGCTGCGLCERICPITTPLTLSTNCSKAYAAYSTNETVRMQSSSGGIFTELAKVVLEEGGVVFGAAYNEQFDVTHIYVDAEEDLGKLRGAKYAQSDLRGIFPEVKTKLDRGQTVLFAGTPCQVAGLKAFLRADYKNLLTVDFVCHSVPSPMAWRKYVKYRAQADNNGIFPSQINLRSKATGWSRYHYSNQFNYTNGNIHTERSGESLYMKLFVGGFISREACADCHFKGYHRVSNLTLGDFWGIWDIAPEMDDDKGTSVLLVHSNKGYAILERIKNNLRLQEVSLQEASAQNQAMLTASKANSNRPEVLACIREGKWSECESYFPKQKQSIVSKLTHFIHSKLHK